jgi:hypothetical protein
MVKIRTWCFGSRMDMLLPLFEMHFQHIRHIAIHIKETEDELQTDQVKQHNTCRIQ